MSNNTFYERGFIMDLSEYTWNIRSIQQNMMIVFRSSNDKKYI